MVSVDCKIMHKIMSLKGKPVKNLKPLKNVTIIVSVHEFS